MTMRCAISSQRGFTQHHFSMVGCKWALRNVTKGIGFSPSNDHVKSGAGFTLVELVLYLGLSSIVILASSSFLTTATTVRVHTKQQQMVQSDVDAVSGKLSYTLRNAYRVDLVESGNRIDVYAHDPDTTDTVVTSFRIHDGALTTGKNTTSPPADLYALTSVATTVAPGPVLFEVVSSSLKVSLICTQGSVTIPFESVYAFRQT